MKEDEKVMPQDTVKVVATDQAQYMVKGNEYTLHRIAAGKLIASGKAILK